MNPQNDTDPQIPDQTAPQPQVGPAPGQQPPQQDAPNTPPQQPPTNQPSVDQPQPAADTQSAVPPTPTQWPTGGGQLTMTPNGQEKPPEPLIRRENGKMILSKKFKIILGIIGGVLLLLLIAVLLFLFVYNNPSYAVANSLQRAVSSDAIDVDVHYKDTPKGQTATIVESQVRIDGQLQSETTANLLLDNNRRDNTVDVRTVTDTQGTAYVKFEKLTEFIASLAEGDTVLTSSLKQFEPLVEGIDNKWVRLQRDDTNLVLDVTENGYISLAVNEVQCTQQFLEIARSDQAVQEELSTLLRDSGVFVPEFQRFDRINGHFASSYNLKVDYGRLDGFVEALRGTSFASQLNTCTDNKFDQAINALKDGLVAANKDDIELKLTYWVDIFTHQPVKLQVEYSTENDNKVFAVTTSDREWQAISLPEQDVRFEEVQKEVESFFDTTFAELQALARDAERQRDTQALAESLEAYYADNFYYLSPSDLNFERISAQLNAPEDSYFAPGLTTFSLQNAVNPEPQKPSTEKYIYQAMTDEGQICDGGKSCQKFVLWYRLESDDKIYSIESFN